MMFVRDGRIWASDTPAEKCPVLTAILTSGEMPPLPPPPRRAFEYKTLAVADAKWSDEIQGLGEQGWDVCAVIPGTGGGYSRIMLKREKTVQDEG